MEMEIKKREKNGLGLAETVLTFGPPLPLLSRLLRPPVPIFVMESTPVGKSRIELPTE